VWNSKHSVLLTGDIEKGAEKSLLQHGEDVASDILVAAHHGSRTSSTPEFIKAVEAKTIVIPVGYRNRYRFPSQEVVKRYEESGALILDTAQSGAISFKLGEDSRIIPLRHRYLQRRYWNVT